MQGHKLLHQRRRFNGLNAGEMRKEAMKGNIKNCPIAPNH
ncbi:MAG: Hypothetical protein LKU_00081 [Lactobacillus kefiranofaciens]